jgi:hypothetical protein
MATKGSRLRAFSSVALWILIVLGAWILSSSDTVIQRAEKLAGERPYCIQVSGNPNYEEAHGKLGLSALTMWGEHGNNHALLVLGDATHPTLWHWSYRGRDFEPDAYGTPAIFCTPQRHFARRLTGSARAPGENVEFYLTGHYFSVPRVFAPEVMTVDRKGMILFTQGSAFAPGPRRPPPGDSHDTFTMVNFDGNRSHLNTATTSRTVPAGRSFGLDRRWVYWSETGRPGTEYFGRAPDGRIITAIRCVDSVIGECLHHFERNGWTYEFHHSPLELEHWQDLETSLAVRVESFARKVDD